MLKVIIINLIILILMGPYGLALAPQSQHQYLNQVQQKSSESKEISISTWLTQITKHVNKRKDLNSFLSEDQWIDICNNTFLNQAGHSSCIFNKTQCQLELTVTSQEGFDEQKVESALNYLFPDVYLSLNKEWIIPLRNFSYHQEAFGGVIVHSLSTFFISFIGFVVQQDEKWLNRFPQLTEFVDVFLRKEPSKDQSIKKEEEPDKTNERRKDILSNTKMFLFLQFLFKQLLSVFMMIIVLGIMFIDQLGLISLVITVGITILGVFIPLLITESLLIRHYKGCSMKIIRDWEEKSLVSSLKYFILDDPFRESPYSIIKILKDFALSSAIASAFFLFLLLSTVEISGLGKMEIILITCTLILSSIGFMILSVVNRRWTIIDDVIRKESERNQILKYVYQERLLSSSDTSPFHKKKEKET